MRLHFQERPWDLYGAIGYSTVIATTLLGLGVGDIFALFLVLLAPGYAIVAAVFPGTDDEGRPGIDWVERFALSFGLSIAIVPLLGLFLNFTLWGMRFVPILVMTTLFTVCVSLVACWRRMCLPRERRLSLTIDLSFPAWKDHGILNKGLTVVLAAGVLIAGGSLAYIALAPRPGEAFTEFYLLGPGGNASAYPTNITVNETGHVILGVVNHEAATLDYTVSVDLVGVTIVYNATSGLNETVEMNRTNLSNCTVVLADGANWTQPYNFSISSIGLWKVQFLLFKDGNFSGAYRELHLFVLVT